jgi:hypothetical protein
MVGIEEELKVLKAQIGELTKKATKKLSSLKGIWKGKSHFSFEEIKQSEIKLKENI